MAAAAGAKLSLGLRLTFFTNAASSVQGTLYTSSTKLRHPHPSSGIPKISVGWVGGYQASMYFDLNVPYVPNQVELQRTLDFLAELGYNTVALDHSIKTKVPADIKNEIPNPLPFKVPPSLHILRRCTLYLSDTTQNHRLSQIAAAYDIFAIRPTNETSLGQACQSLECDLVSLDLTQRYPFHFKHKTFNAAFQRGIKFEICYASGIPMSDGGISRRNLISNAAQLIRATRGRGLVISGEATRPLTCRAPADVVNLAVVWGLGQDKAVETVSREARNVVAQAEMKRRSFRGVIDVVKGGEPPKQPSQETQGKKHKQANGKRKATAVEDGALETSASSKPISKREQKRQAKKARIEARVLSQEVEVQVSEKVT